MTVLPLNEVEELFEASGQTSPSTPSRGSSTNSSQNPSSVDLSRFQGVAFQNLGFGLQV